MKAEYTYKNGEKITATLADSPDTSDEKSLFYPSASGIEVLEKALVNTVGIGIQGKEEGEDFENMATGVIANYKGNKYLLTASHCIRAGHKLSKLVPGLRNDTDISSILSFFGVGKEGTYRSLAELPRTYDKVSENKKLIPAADLTAFYYEGDIEGLEVEDLQGESPAYAIGFPGIFLHQGVKGPLASKGRAINRPTGRAEKENILEGLKKMKESFPGLEIGNFEQTALLERMIEYSGLIFPGMSGGPLVSDTGRLIGITTSHEPIYTTADPIVEALEVSHQRVMQRKD